MSFFKGDHNSSVRLGRSVLAVSLACMTLLCACANATIAENEDVTAVLKESGDRDVESSVQVEVSSELLDVAPCRPLERLPEIDGWVPAPTARQLRQRTSDKALSDARVVMAQHLLSAEGLAALPEPVLLKQVEADYAPELDEQEAIYDGILEGTVDIKWLRRLGFCNDAVDRELSVSLLAGSLANGLADATLTSLGRAERFGSLWLYYAYMVHDDPVHDFARAVDAEFNVERLDSPIGLLQWWRFVASHRYCLSELGLADPTLVLAVMERFFYSSGKSGGPVNLGDQLEELGYPALGFGRAFDDCLVRSVPLRFQRPIEDVVFKLILYEELEKELVRWIQENANMIPSNLTISP